MTNLTQKGPHFTRLLQSTSSNNESFNNNKLPTVHPGTRSPPLTNFDSKISDSTAVLTETEDRRIPTTVSVKKVSRVEPLNMSNNQQLNESKVKDDINRPTTVNVVRLKRVPNLNATDEGTPEDVSNETSKQFDQVTVTKLSRKKSSKSQRSRSASSTSVDQLNMEMQPIVNPTKKSVAPTTDPQVKVSKVPRRLGTTQSYCK